jgi:transcriptional regulator with XRE-family HTH domain
MKATHATRSYGEWLRRHRQARGWAVVEMSRRLRQAATKTGDTLPDNECLTTMIRRWENGGGVSERYRMHFCQAFGIALENFGKAPPRPVSPGRRPASASARPGALGLEPLRPGARAAQDWPAGNWPAGVAGQAATVHRPTIEGEVLMTAHEGSEHVEYTERRDIGEATLEQLRAEVTRLSREYMTGEPLPLFFEMRRVRNRLYTALDRRVWPRDQTELYFLLGTLSALMADAAGDLGSPASAEELARAGWAYATVIDHRPLKAWLRIELAHVSRWTGQPIRCRNLALSGLEFLTDGPNGALLHMLHGVGAAKLGDADAARQAINQAADAREHDYSDDLLEIGGQFGFSLATQHYYAGTVAVDLPGAELDAIRELEQAMDLYAAGPGPGEHHSLHCRMKALADLASARLRAGQLDGAESAAGLIFGLPPSQRAATLPRHLDRVRAELAQPRYQGSAGAKDLDEQIEEFCRDTLAQQLSELPRTDAG